MCHKYSPAEDCCEERRFIASCIAFNIELNLIDELLSFNLPGKTEEWTLKNYDSKTFKVWELPDGLITNTSSTKRFTIFYHSASKLFYSVLKTTQPDNYERFKNLCYELKNSDEDFLF